MPMASPPDQQRFVIVPQRQRASRWWWAFLGLFWVVSLLFVAWVATERAAPGSVSVRGAKSMVDKALGQQKDELEDLRQQVATLRRSDQISRAANTELQVTLAEREEEISGLRADVAFYERLVGATGQRRGLSVHEATFRPQEGGGWRYIVTLTQNLNRGAISKGEMRFSVEGVKDGKLTSLNWTTLLQKPSAGGQAYSFRYFQQLEGSIMLPAGFTPQRVSVSLRGGGQAVDQKFDWTTE